MAVLGINTIGFSLFLGLISFDRGRWSAIIPDMMTDTYEPDDATFTADAYREGSGRSVAWRILGWETEPDEDTEWSGYEVRTGRVIACMVGDDVHFTFDPAELVALGDLDYCAECGQIGCTQDGRGSCAKAITVFDCAKARGVVEGDDGSVTGSEFERVGLPFFGGCERCSATIAAFNAYPSQSGYLRCGDCIGGSGFDTPAAFEVWVADRGSAPAPRNPPPDTHK